MMTCPVRTVTSKHCRTGDKTGLGSLQNVFVKKRRPKCRTTHESNYFSLYGHLEGFAKSSYLSRHESDSVHAVKMPD